MPLLAYCIVETSAAVEVPRTGVDDMPVQSIRHTGLRCFVSEIANKDQLSGEQIREAALVFHRVLEEIFRQVAVIPFRFPTILSGNSELIEHMAERSKEYISTLDRLRDMVQMEIMITVKGSASPESLHPESLHEDSAKPSGTEYLRRLQTRRAKFELAAREFQKAGAPMIKRWGQRDSVAGIRCFALIERSCIDDYKTELQAVAIQPGLNSRLSGPWPATQFLKEA